MKFRWRSPQELADYRDAELRRLLVHAYENVPYYRALFDRHRLHPRHVRGVVDLDLIPMSSKPDMRSVAPEKVIAAGHDPARLLTARTSGATGQPFVIRRTWLEDKRNHLFRLRALASMGMRLGHRRVAVGLLRPTDPNDLKRIARPLRRLGVSDIPRLNGLEEPEVIAARLRGRQRVQSKNFRRTKLVDGSRPHRGGNCLHSGFGNPGGAHESPAFVESVHCGAVRRACRRCMQAGPFGGKIRIPGDGLPFS